MKKILFTIFIIVMNAGCAVQQMTAEQSAKIHTIKVDRVIQMPEEMYINAPNPVATVCFGALGSAISSDIAKKNKFQALNSIKKEIPEMVAKSVENELKRNSRFKPAQKGRADAVMKIHVKLYGFSIPNGYSSVVKPMINLQAELYDLNGVVIWQDYTLQSLLTSDLPTYDPDRLSKNPNLMRAALNIAAHDAAQKLVQAINKTSD